MRKRTIGIALASLVIVALVGLFFINRPTPVTNDTANQADLTVITGVIGSEKKAFFEDAKVQQILADNGLKVEIETAGSRQIATEVDLNAYDFAFPSSAPAAQKIQDKMKVSSVYAPFFSPMVVATYKPVVELLAQNGAASQDAEGVWHINMEAYLQLVADGKRWNELTGAAELYNSPRSVLISSTDVRKSNSAAMYLSIASYVLNGNSVVSTTAQQEQALPQLSELFLAQGYSGASSDEPFQDYLSQGSGAVPMVMLYEAQFMGEALKENSRITDQMVIAYPDPTVFSKHTLIPFNKDSEKLGKLLTNDAELVSLEAQYGFRTADNAAFIENAETHNVAIQQSLTNIAETPSYDVLEALLTAITEQYNQ